MAHGRIKVLHLISGLRTGGAEMMLYKLLSRMDSGRFASSVVSMSSEGTVGERIRALGVPVDCLGLRPGRPSIAGFCRLGRLLLDRRPDVVQGWMYHANAVTIVLRFLLSRPAVIWGIRGDLRLKSLSPTARASNTLCASFSRWVPDVVLFNSRRSLESHREAGYNGIRMRIIPNGFDLARFCPFEDARGNIRHFLGLGPETELIGMVSRFKEGEKDHATFLEAAERLRRRRAGVHFLLCGRGMSDDNVKLVSEISGRRLTRAVHLLGERNDIPEVTTALDVATLASLVEGFPNVVGEAMACGVPVVATDVGDCRDIIGDAGIVVPPRDAEALAEAWWRLLEAGREGRERIGQRGRERVAELYDLSKIVLQYEELYEELARGVRRSCVKEPEKSRMDRCAASAVP